MQAKELNPDAIEEMVSAVSSILSFDQSREQRMALLELFKQQCLMGVSQP